MPAHWVGARDLAVDGERVRDRTLCVVWQRQPERRAWHPHLVVDYQDVVVPDGDRWRFVERVVDSDLTRG